MASPPFDVAQAVPGDNDFASQFPPAERSYRDIVESWLSVNHDTNGRHKYVELADQASDPTFATGVIGLWNNAGVPKLRLGSNAVFVFDAFATGTKLTFAQAAPPSGWSIDVTAADRLLRVNTTGAGLGGTWTLSGISVDGHTLSIAEMPSHTHTSGGPVTIAGFAGSAGNPVANNNQNTGPAGGDQPHNHTLTIGNAWRPAYLDVVVGTKN